MNENLNNNVNNNLNNQQGMNNNINNEQKKNNNIIIIAVIILAVVLLLVILWKPSYKNDTPYVPKDNPKQVEKPEEKTQEEREDLEAEAQSIADELFEKLTEPFDELYYSEGLDKKINYNDYYDFDSIPNDLKVEIALHYIEGFDITKESIKGALKKAFGNDIDLSSLKFPKTIGNPGCSGSLNEKENRYVFDVCTGTGKVDTYSKIIKSKTENDELIVYKRYVLREYITYGCGDEDAPNVCSAIKKIYSDGKKKNLIYENKNRNKGYYSDEEDEKLFIIERNEFEKAFEKGSTYKLTFKKQGNDYYFVSMEKQNSNIGV